MRAKLGQNFLRSRSTVNQILAAADPTGYTTIVEIGPGHGELTLPMMEKFSGMNIIGVEKDPELAGNLKEVARAKNFKLEIILGDIRRELPKIAQGLGQKKEKYLLLGNIPYYLTGYLLRILSGLDHPPSASVLMVQKEVADRIMARDGQNRLSASVAGWAKASLVCRVPKKLFSPRPQVDSAVIKLESQPLPSDIQPADYYRLIQILFAQPRKTISNNLSVLKKDFSGLEALARAKISPQMRPGQLSFLDLLKLTRLLFS